MKGYSYDDKTYKNAIKYEKVTVSEERSAYAVLALFAVFIGGSWAVYDRQFLDLPRPLSLDEAGQKGFSEAEAMKHITYLTGLGSHPVGSDALDDAVKYVGEAALRIKEEAPEDVDVEVDFFHVKSGLNNALAGLFVGQTFVYQDLKHVLVRITHKNDYEAKNSSVLVSAHIDTVIAGEGAGDDSSSIAVMLELARGISQSTQRSQNGIIFFFNTGEENGLNGAHGFVTKHPWRDTVKVAIDLEANGLGGKSSIFQAGPKPWSIENFAISAKYPSAQIIMEDVFHSGISQSGTDFQMYLDAGYSGLDFAYQDITAVYHTKNDKLELLKPGSLQHLGENMLGFLLHAASSSELQKENKMAAETDSRKDKVIYFDILGAYMITYRQRFADMLYNLVISLSVFILGTWISYGGHRAVVTLALSCSSIILMWACSIAFSVAAAFIITLLTSSTMPCLSSPWLAFGLFTAPAVLGAFTGQHVGYILLKTYLPAFSFKSVKLPADLIASNATLDAERWLFKAGLLQWLIVLAVGNYYQVGSTYLALVWFVSPTIAYCLLESPLSPSLLLKPLSIGTILVGLLLPMIIFSGMAIRLTTILIWTNLLIERNPGDTSDWTANIILAIFIAALVCLTMVHLLSYVHTSGAKIPIIVSSLVLFALSLAAVWGGLVPAYTADMSRVVNVVHVVNATQSDKGNQERTPFVSIFSKTPGNLIKETENIGRVVCGRDRDLDFVTFSVTHSCWMDTAVEAGWQESNIPIMHVAEDMKGDSRNTTIAIDTKESRRWFLAVNIEEIEDFQLKDEVTSEELVPLGEKTNLNGWNTVQFSGGKNSTTKFILTLFWKQTTSNDEKDGPLLKLRTDTDRVTPLVQHVLDTMPEWCSLYGKSTSPYTYAFVRNIPIAL